MTQDLTGAVEGIIKNKGELFSSFDVDAFEVPHGRDEMWRFTPLRRLRGLHDGSAPATGTAKITVSEQPGVQTETVRRGDPSGAVAGELTLAQLSILVTLLDQGPIRMTDLAAHERVRAVVGLAPWLEPQDPVDTLDGRHLGGCAHAHADERTFASAVLDAEPISLTGRRPP